MNLDQIETKCFILALFIRDDGERFLLGSRAYEFVDSQLHFVANSYQNDIVEVQGNDGIMLAGQVRRGTSQPFDGYIGDQTVDRSTIEQYRRNFMKFFRKNHYYKVVYVFPDGSAVQRRNGFIVEAPEVKELYQLFPQYHISMNFEDINYYVYEEDSEGEEIYGESATLKIATSATGGLIWEEGTESEISGEGSQFTLQDTIDGNVLDSVQLKGDTTQQTYSGQNLYNFADTFAVSDEVTVDSDGWITITYDNSGGSSVVYKNYYTNPIPQLVASTEYDIYLEVKNVSGDARLNLVDNSTASSNGSQFAVDVIPFFNTLSNNSVYKYTSTTKSDMSNAKTSIRTYGQFRAGDSGTITFRITVTEHSSATANDFTYEPYVGGVPAPNPDYPQTVNTVTGRQVVDVYGKNLLDSSTFEPSWISNTGEIGNDPNNALFDYMKVSANTTYTASFNGAETLQISYAFYDSSKTFLSRVANHTFTSSDTLTTPANCAYVRIWVHRGSAWTQALIDSYDFQFELGSSATPYESHQSYEVNLGKNLLDPSILIQGHINGGTPTNRVCTRSGDDIYVSGGGTYTISVSDIAIQVNVYGYKLINGTAIYESGWQTMPFTFELPSQANYLRLMFRYSNDSDIVPNDITCQLEKGSTATTYAPYFTPIELCKIGTYQDYIYKSGDDWYVHKAVGHASLIIADMDMSNDTPGWTGQTAIKNDIGTNVGGSLGARTSYITNISGITSYGTTGDPIQINFNNDNALVILRQTYFNLTQTQWKTNYSNLTVELYYGIAVGASQTDTQITNADLIAQLNALAGATTYDGQTVFTVTSENQLAILDVTVIARTGGGVVWDNYGAEWEEGTGGGPTMVNVDSIDNVYPVLTLTGPAVNPQISVLTTNTTLSYSGTVTSSQELKIDMFNKTATLNGASVVGNVSGDWVYLKPGVNRITYTTNNADAPDSIIWWQEIVG